MLVAHDRNNRNATMSYNKARNPFLLQYQPGTHRDRIGFSPCSRLVANDYYCQLHGCTTCIILDLGFWKRLEYCRDSNSSK